jgi:digeranylgeranylglycerophospholipid reductase
MKKTISSSALQELYDIIIVGAGPAGLCAGKHVLAGPKKPSVLLLDRVVPWELPIQCAEGVGKLGLEEAIGPAKPSWIRQVISSACFHAPDGSTITYTDRSKGYIVNRAAMQHDLASDLMKTGASCLFNNRVAAIGPVEEGAFRRVMLGTGQQVQGRVVIDASGPVAGLARGERIAWKPVDLEPAYFILAENIDLPDDMVHIYVARDLAPGGYAWVFPRGKGSANIGIVVGGSFKGKVNIRGLLEAFLARHFPLVTISRRFAGAIPCGGHKNRPLSLPRLIKTGDAANTVNPISRAGITEAMLCGNLAGDHALLMLAAKNARDMTAIGKSYESAWRKKRGARHEKLAKVKNSMLAIPDSDYNRAARSLSSIPREELTMSKIFRTALGRFPRLVWALRHLM